jgi:3'-phosphoadenosine 5'-phosphosulfate sulfotransferase (PAPS reductase)/FAD synthetase
MPSVKVYLSHGGGVNSWALYLWLIDQGEVPGQDFEAVFVDHGTDWPETYGYLEMMVAKGYPVTVIRPEYDDCNSVYERCLKRQVFPGRQPGFRWCTQEFKVKPLADYYQKPCIELIGFDVSEKHRKTGLVGKTGVEQDFPLIAAGIDRQGCIDIIKRHGLLIPPKSGCWICPFQTRAQWIELRRRHPDLFCKAVQLENLCNERRAAAGKKPVYFRDIPLETLVLPKDSHGRRATSDMTLFDPDFDQPPCRCRL